MPITRIKSISYRERHDLPLEWSITGLELGPVNLLVGRNSSGKSRSINIIHNLAKQLLQGQLASAECEYNVEFETDGNATQYVLHAHGGKVVSEQVSSSGKQLLSRTEQLLTIHAQEMGSDLHFRPAENEVSAVSRYDSLQHQFLSPLLEWAKSVRTYHFGSHIGQLHVALIIKDGPRVDDRDENRVVGIIRKGIKEYPTEYVKTVVGDMNEVGFKVTSVGVSVPEHMTMQFAPFGAQPDQAIPPPGDINAVCISEDGIGAPFFQDSISQGMFRTLSVLAQIEYSQMAKTASCILIDDIGEGLDFERSSALIKLLRRKSAEHGFQLIMSTNDQFVMNDVPLGEWSILQRRGNAVSVRNIHNSQKAFDDFKFVGLNNFAFFETDFASADAEDSPQLKLDGMADDEKNGDLR